MPSRPGPRRGRAGSGRPARSAVRWGRSSRIQSVEVGAAWLGAGGDVQRDRGVPRRPATCSPAAASIRTAVARTGSVATTPTGGAVEQPGARRAASAELDRQATGASVSSTRGRGRAGTTAVPDAVARGRAAARVRRRSRAAPPGRPGCRPTCSWPSPRRLTRRPGRSRSAEPVTGPASRWDMPAPCHSPTARGGGSPQGRQQVRTCRRRHPPGDRVGAAVTSGGRALRPCRGCG